ncbi:MAG TPA: MerR family transcriptional regulator [Ramlibacter sp.]|nr:MerR family transcriptional regulator [Ramlibacter sp.]
MLLKVGELARHTGLTVRSLHHYDEIGLLKPSDRSESGYRLYSRADVARLHGIQALRHLGLALTDIAAMLDGPGASPGHIIEQQMRSLERQIAQASELRERLDLLQHALAKGNEPDMAEWLDTLALMTTYGKYFSAAELKAIFANWALIEAQWQPLVDAVRGVMDRRTAIDTVEVQSLAQRWMNLMLRWMGGNFDLIDRWGDMYRQEPGAAGRNGAPQADMIDYIRSAIDLRMALLHKHISQEELRSFTDVPEADWEALRQAVLALIDEGVPAGDPRARAVAGRWLGLLDRVVGQRPGVRNKLLAAYAQEPLLAAGSRLAGPMRDYLGRSLREMLDPHVT